MFFNSIVFPLGIWLQIASEKIGCNWGHYMRDAHVNSCLSDKKLETIMSHYLTPINEAS
jgi:hypothetical protein